LLVGGVLQFIDEIDAQLVNLKRLFSLSSLPNIRKKFISPCVSLYRFRNSFTQFCQGDGTLPGSQRRRQAIENALDPPIYSAHERLELLSVLVNPCRPSGDGDQDATRS